MKQSPHQSIDQNKAVVQPLLLPEFATSGIRADILRLDLIHPVISGNKWFKLKYHLKSALDEGYKGLLTFGGAWSNHLVATAGAAAAASLTAVGIVRGEIPAVLSPALQDARDSGMQLVFVSRNEYADETTLHRSMQERFPGHYLVPQGGHSEAGVRGASEILSLVPELPSYTHIACAAGTGTMMAGLVVASNPQQQVLGISSLKLANTAHNSLETMLQTWAPHSGYRLFYQFHFGGYARKTAVLTDFMNRVWKQTGIPTDIVYTGKLLYGISSLATESFFPSQSRLLLIHSGGLQGNRSLPPGTLLY
ncbi:MAG: 1-aminocyclopropane-1-carboxylate deaminase/D-cysteine desulfhydrase [Pseudobacter sp.]|uniref:1-aminocyclopropane-1-carboxylate deaminase/D-cysteine desulfhydrase n=1 Tax=Pseudobacter sp. TaxID=2045420 RepID=UPI003F80CD53